MSLLPSYEYIITTKNFYLNSTAPVLENTEIVLSDELLSSIHYQFADKPTIHVLMDIDSAIHLLFSDKLHSVAIDNAYHELHSQKITIGSTLLDVDSTVHILLSDRVYESSLSPDCSIHDLWSTEIVLSAVELSVAGTIHELVSLRPMIPVRVYADLSVIELHSSYIQLSDLSTISPTSTWHDLDSSILPVMFYRNTVKGVRDSFIRHFSGVDLMEIERFFLRTAITGIENCKHIHTAEQCKFIHVRASDCVHGHIASIVWNYMDNAEHELKSDTVLLHPYLMPQHSFHQLTSLVCGKVHIVLDVDSSYHCFFSRDVLASVADSFIENISIYKNANYRYRWRL